MRTMRFDGRIVADAERKISKSGKEYVTFRVANNEKDRDGNEETYWYRIISWNHIGLSSYLTKGKYIIIEGDYRDNVYQSREGKCEIGRDVLANAIYFVKTGDGNSNNATQNKPTTASPVTQTKMEQPKPTTAELKVPTMQPVNNNDDDDLPF